MNSIDSLLFEIERICCAGTPPTTFDDFNKRSKFRIPAIGIFITEES
ncbi:MAG TPA: hypothetical protein VE544_11085 [Nitrososphaeraceae archaeon]|nr:hypothetical protein [Nitrososphaeraceae archaeon]